MKISEILSESTIEYDNPGGEWLENKIEDAKIAERKYNSPSASMNSITAWTPKPIPLPTVLLASFPGAMHEDRKEGDPQFDALYAHIKKEGWDDTTSILVGVNYRGMPYVLEGNTRIAVAQRLGVDSIRTIVRWFTGGERFGRYRPEHIEEWSKRTSL